MIGINGTLASSVCKWPRYIWLGVHDSFRGGHVRQSRECLPLQSPTKTRRARTCPSRAALRTRPSNTAPSAPPTAWAPPPPQPQLPPLHPPVPPHQTRAQRRTRHGGARPRHSPPAADGPASRAGWCFQSAVPRGKEFALCFSSDPLFIVSFRWVCCNWK